MMSNSAAHTFAGSRKALRSAGPLALAVATMMAAGCKGLLDVELPGAIEEKALEGTRSVNLFVNSMIGAYECAFTNYVSIAGAVSDELYSSGTQQVDTQYDQLVFTADYASMATDLCESVGGLYTPLSQARYLADEATRRLEAASDAEVANRTRLLATTRAYAGYSYVLFGEGFCSAAFDEGPELQPKQVLEIAEQRFTTALGLARTAGDTEIEILARLGRARARLGLGNRSGAAEDARLVPKGYAKWVTREQGILVRQNKVYFMNNLERRNSVAREFWDLKWQGVPDPRVKLVHSNTLASDGITPLVTQTKYTSLAAPLPLATYDEAQLIVAEAVGGQTAVNIINELHAAVGLPPFTGTGDEIAKQVIEERRRELFLEGHRLGDLLRLKLPFPSGQPFTGRFYGKSTCFPLPNVERNNNPSIQGKS
ncbi:MAG: RagB/SusD family nutrient uptake outer membrane protein [Gemmatimonadetes bacterium]|nr:RagB/SusD family nutrient uptake outer membrane protein [Gemmatimonadota bacterium]